MRYLIVVVLAIMLIGLLAPEAAAQDEPEKLIETAKELFAEKKWTKALAKFKLALQVGAKDESALETALYIGAIYAEMDQNDLAQQGLKKYLAEHPAVEVPAEFTKLMKAALEEARSEFPMASNIMLEKETFRPYRESLGITFTVKAKKSVLEKTTITLRITSEERKVVLLETPVKLDSSASVQRFTWDGKNKFSTFLENGNYVLLVDTVREDGWKHSCRYRVVVESNLKTPEVVTLQRKARRIESIAGQYRVECIPGKRFVKIGEKPLKASMKGFWNHVYYIPLGAIRDGLDFPIKFLLSLDGVGHVLTATGPFVGGYELGRSLWKLDKKDYYDPLFGFDKDAWDNDKQVVKHRSFATGALGPVWAMAYAGIMSVVCWAGTDEGVVKGFKSYIDSNVLMDGYDSKYFFPNYRSLDFSSVRVDEEELARLEARVRMTNKDIQSQLNSLNKEVTAFNRDRFAEFKREIIQKLNKNLHDRAHMKIKGREK
jgi:hypothetical protein